MQLPRPTPATAAAERRAAVALAPARRGAAKRNSREGYRQDRVLGADHRFSGFQANLRQRVASWLRRVVLASRPDTR